MNIRIKTKLDLFIAAVTDGMGTDRQHDQGMVRLFKELLGKDPKATLPLISYGQLQANLQMYSACLEEYMNLLVEMEILMVGPNVGRYATFCLTDHARGQFVNFQNGVIPDQDDWQQASTPLVKE